MVAVDYSLGRGPLGLRRLNQCAVIATWNPVQRTSEALQEIASGRTGTNLTGPPCPGHSVRLALLTPEFPVLLVLLEGMKVAVHVTGTVPSSLQLNSYWEEGPVARHGFFKSPSL